MTDNITHYESAVATLKGIPVDEGYKLDALCAIAFAVLAVADELKVLNAQR